MAGQSKEIPPQGTSLPRTPIAQHLLRSGAQYSYTLPQLAARNLNLQNSLENGDN